MYVDVRDKWIYCVCSDINLYQKNIANIVTLIQQGHAWALLSFTANRPSNKNMRQMNVNINYFALPSTLFLFFFDEVWSAFGRKLAVGPRGILWLRHNYLKVNFLIRLLANWPLTVNIAIFNLLLEDELGGRKGRKIWLPIVVEFGKDLARISNRQIDSFSSFSYHWKFMKRLKTSKHFDNFAIKRK